MTVITTRAEANARLATIGRRRQWILDAEALFTEIEGGITCDLFASERSGLSADFVRVIGQMKDNDWPCCVSGRPPRLAVCTACTAIGMTAARQRCPERGLASRGDGGPPVPRTSAPGPAATPETQPFPRG
jgi:hypothetical protein